MRRPPPGMVTASPPSASRQPQRVGDAVALLLGQLQAARRLDVERGPGRMQPVGQPLGVAHEPGGARILADADQDALAGRPRARRWRCACIWVSSCSSTRSAVRRSASSRSAVRLAGEKKCSSARSACFGNVDLAFLQPLDQVVRREVDQLDGVGAVEDGIRHGLAHAHVRDLRDDVVQAFDVLDVDGRCRRRCRASAAPRRRDSAWDGGCRARWCAQARRPARSAAGAR